MDEPPGVILALDPSSTHVGWALFNVGADKPIYIASGTEKVPEAPQDIRLVLAGDVVKSLIARRGPISFAIVEIPDFIADNAKAHIIYYFRAVGAVEYVLHELNIRVVPVSASRNKHRDLKQQGKERFYEATGRYPITSDESDAYWIGHDYLSEQIEALSALPDDESERVYDEP